MRNFYYIIVLGDNGTSGDVMDEDLPGFPDKNANLRGKGTLYQGGISVPMIISAPEPISPARRSSNLVHTSDVYATILDIAGVSSKRGMKPVDGISFFNSLKPRLRRYGSRRFSWSDYGPNPAVNIKKNPHDSPWGYVIRDFRYKLKSEAIYDEQGNVECMRDLEEGQICKTWEWKTTSSLYDLYRDPTEQDDLLLHDLKDVNPRELYRYLQLRRQQHKILGSVEN